MAAALTVTGVYPTITTIAVNGNPGDYSLTATVSGNGSASPTGTVSFLDISNSNESLVVAPLTPAAAGLNLIVVEGFNPVFLPENFVVGDFNGDGIPDELVVCAYRRYRLTSNEDCQAMFRLGIKHSALSFYCCRGFKIQRKTQQRGNTA